MPRAKVVVAEDQEQADKILSIRSELPALESIVYSDPRGMTDYDEDILASFSGLLEQGRGAEGRFRGALPGGGAGGYRADLLHVRHDRAAPRASC